MAYVIGLDYGTSSCRGIAVNCTNGEMLAEKAAEYPHGVMDEELCGNGERLPKNWALEHPMDYLEVMKVIVPDIVNRSGVDAAEIIGLGVDFTSCTLLPVDKEGNPLCVKEQFAGRRNAYAKLWKHHGAQKYADRINAFLETRGSREQERFGGKISPELFLPKVMELFHEDREVYDAADEILEAGDWVTRVLTGSHKRSCSMAGYKAWWNDRSGYPDSDFFEAVDPDLKNLVQEKMPGEVVGIGERIGGINEKWAEILNLKPGTAVSSTIIDSHAGVPGSGIWRKDQIMLVLGTSSVMIKLSDQPYSEKGIMGGVKNAIVPGYYALESGLASVGDLFGWFVNGFIPEKYQKQAKQRNQNVHEYLSAEAAKMAPGQSGLLALDWWNGNKTPFVNADLKGSIVGMTLTTKPEEIYRTLIEATAFGTRRILDIYEQVDGKAEEIICSGGISRKNPFVMQLYADILGKKLKVAASDQAAALGSAVYASLAAGKSAEGYDDYAEAVQAMSRVEDREYIPDMDAHAVYDTIYSVYCDYSDIMGRSHKEIMDRMNATGSR